MATLEAGLVVGNAVCRQLVHDIHSLVADLAFLLGTQKCHEIQGATHLQTSWTTATGHLQRPDPVGCISSSCSKNEVGRGRKMNDCEGESRKEKKKRWNGKGRLMVWLRFRRRSVGWICWREEERVSKKLITFQTFWLGHGIINVALVGSIYPFLNLPPLRQLIQEMNYISQTKSIKWKIFML